MPVDLEHDEARLAAELRKYFAKNGILKLRTLIAHRKNLLIPAGVARMSYETAEKQINEIALSGIVTSITDLVTEKHVALIKLLNQEEILWTMLKQAIREKDARQIERLRIGIDALLDKELRLVPTDARAQAVLVQMTPRQMEKLVGLR
ncbi:MAG: hypothetical protein QXR48_03640 [Candidatus Woesearchaeota archaeon]